MKRGTVDHPKVKDLARLLHKPCYSAVGLLEMLWHMVARYTPRGDIGHYSDREIARALYWTGKPENLIKAMLASRWLDADPVHRLLVHDWADHADQTVRRVLAARKQDFARPMLASTSIDASIMPTTPTVDASPPVSGVHSHSHRPAPAASAAGVTDEEPEGFSEFWQAYPKKVGKAQARKAWTKTQGKRPELAVILGALSAAKESDQWQGDEGRYIPHPATWINAERWSDEMNSRIDEDSESYNTPEDIANGKRLAAELADSVKGVPAEEIPTPFE